jgi:hypothetical protein
MSRRPSPSAPPSPSGFPVLTPAFPDASALFSSSTQKRSFVFINFRTLCALDARRNRRNPFPPMRFRTLARTIGGGGAFTQFAIAGHQTRFISFLLILLRTLSHSSPASPLFATHTQINPGVGGVPVFSFPRYFITSLSLSAVLASPASRFPRPLRAQQSSLRAPRLQPPRGCPTSHPVP